jgi:hypothetical protein
VSKQRILSRSTLYRTYKQLNVGKHTIKYIVSFFNEESYKLHNTVVDKHGRLKINISKETLVNTLYELIIKDGLCFDTAPWFKNDLVGNVYDCFFYE